jgi:serine/threonine protein kinase
MLHQAQSLGSFIGSECSHYRSVKKLGGAGIDVVYKAEDTRLRPNVALKFFPDNLMKGPQAVVHFQEEARVSSVRMQYQAEAIRRLAVEPRLQRNGAITITRSKRNLPVFVEQFPQ